mgnify:FL=1|tara:strand:+ start:433 stop:741 length:309 start_codon:yes stop_codon:yes gene_type:complete
MQLSRTEAIRAALAAGTGKNGQKSVSTSSVALTTDAFIGSHGVAVKAATSNTDKVYVGIGTVTSSNGMELNPGEGVTIKVDKASAVEAISASGTQTVAFIQT